MFIRCVRWIVLLPNWWIWNSCGVIGNIGAMLIFKYQLIAIIWKSRWEVKSSSPYWDPDKTPRFLFLMQVFKWIKAFCAIYLSRKHEDTREGVWQTIWEQRIVSINQQTSWRIIEKIRWGIMESLELCFGRCAQGKVLGPAESEKSHSRTQMP